MATQISKTDFRDAMARVCAPVNIVTTDGPHRIERVGQPIRIEQVYDVGGVAVLVVDTDDDGVRASLPMKGAGQDRGRFL